MKKIIKYIILIAILLGALFLVFVLTTKDKDTDAVKFKSEYEKYNGEKTDYNKVYPQVNISKKNSVVYADYNKLFEIFDGKTGIIYLGFPECPWCRNAVPVLLDAANDYENLNIYYMNMKEERDQLELDEQGKIKTVKKASDNYKKLLKYLDQYLTEYELEDKDKNIVKTGEKRVYVPLVVFVKDGKIIGTHVDTVETQNDPFTPLTTDEKSQLKEIYTSYINEIFACSTHTKGC